MPLTVVAWCHLTASIDQFMENNNEKELRQYRERITRAY